MKGLWAGISPLLERLVCLLLGPFGPQGCGPGPGGHLLDLERLFLGTNVLETVESPRPWHQYGRQGTYPNRLERLPGPASRDVLDYDNVIRVFKVVRK